MTPQPTPIDRARLFLSLPTHIQLPPNWPEILKAAKESSKA